MKNGDRTWQQSVRRWLPGLLLSLLAIALLLRLTDWRDVQKALSSIELHRLLLAVLLFLMSIFSRSLGWSSLLQDRAPLQRVFLALNEGYLLNNVFPFRLGEIGRAVLLGQSSGLSPLYVISTIVIERAFDLGIAAGLLLATLPLVLGFTAARPIALATLGFVVIGLFALYLAARYRERLQAWFGTWKYIPGWALPRLNALLEGFGALARPSQFLLGAILIAGSWAFGVLETYTLLNSGMFSAPFWWTGFVLGVLSLGVALPSAPASLGVYEAAIVGALSLLKVSPADALAFAVVLHLIQIVSTGSIGVYALAQDGETISGLYSRVRESLREFSAG